MHSSHTFELVLVRFVALDCHRCVFGGLNDLPQEPEKLCCDYLLLPRVDCKQGWALLQHSLPDVVTKMGESIGVETKLYSLQAR